MNYLTASTVDTHGDDDRKVAIAQVHATLYLAEQQRIANLIALAGGDVADVWPVEGRWETARKQIVEGLGL